VPAHTKVQKLYFGDDFLLRRLDYTTDVLAASRRTTAMTW